MSSDKIRGQLILMVLPVLPFLHIVLFIPSGLQEFVQMPGTSFSGTLFLRRSNLNGNIHRADIVAKAGSVFSSQVIVNAKI